MSKYTEIKTRIAEACARVGRDPESVKLIAASKGQSVEKIRALWEEGQRDFAENYVQEWEKKRADLEKLLPDSGIRWHFIGHLQSNKLKHAVGHCDWLQTLDSLRLTQKADAEAREQGIMQSALIEVRFEQDENKTGWLAKYLPAEIRNLSRLNHLHIVGLMTIPPIPENPEDSRPFFKSMKALLDECNQIGAFSPPMKELSMGMSRDFEIAIEEGATMIRVGEALFGPR